MSRYAATGAAVTPGQLAAARSRPAAGTRRAALTVQLDALLATIDVLAGPTSDGPAWPITHALQVGPLDAYHRARGAAQPHSAEFTTPMDQAGVPAICLPCGLSPEGLPYNLQFTGRRLSEAMLCRVAYAYEQATDWRRRHPPVQA